MAPVKPVNSVHLQNQYATAMSTIATSNPSIVVAIEDVTAESEVATDLMELAKYKYMHDVISFTDIRIKLKALRTQKYQTRTIAILLNAAAKFTKRMIVTAIFEYFSAIYSLYGKTWN